MFCAARTEVLQCVYDVSLYDVRHLPAVKNTYCVVSRLLGSIAVSNCSLMKNVKSKPY
jgi:hypothetical protein